MQEGQERVSQEHPWTRVSHHMPNTLPHIGFVAVDSAGSTRCLTFLYGTSGKALSCIVEKFATFEAESSSRSVLLAAIDF